MRSITSFVGYAMLAVVALAPLTIGAVDAWAWATIALITGALGLVCMIDVITKSKQIPARHLLMPAILCGVAFVWAGLQMSNSFADSVHPISEAAKGILPNVSATISLNPDATQQTLLRWLMYTVTFFIAFVWGKNPDRARDGLNVLVIAGAVYAVYGLAIIFVGSDMAMWVHKPMYIPDVSGPFINRNNFASYLGALLCVALGLLLRRIVRDTSGMRGAEFWRHLLTCCTGRGAWLLASSVAMFTALLLTHSRAGLASFVVSLCALIVLLRASGILRGKFLYWGAGGVFAILVVLFFTSGDIVFDRLVSGDEVARPQLYELDISAIADRPWVGHGLGSFPQVFQIYRNEDIPPGFFTERAHSVYLENMLELGIPAALCLFIGIGWLMVSAALSVRSGERHRTIPVVTTAAAVMLCTHSLIDFPLQIPAITLLFAFLLGLGAAQAKN